MNILNKVALQGLKKNRTRTLVTIIGVALSAAMITAVATFGTSLLNFLVNTMIVDYGNWHVEFTQVDSSFVQEQAANEEVSDTAAFENIGYAALAGAQSAEKPYLFLAGFDDKTFDTLPITLISGNPPQNSKEVLVPSHVAAKGGVRYAIGDTINLAVGTRQAGDETLNQHDTYRPGEEALVNTAEKTYTVVGTYERPEFEEHSAPGYTLITKADAENQAGTFSLFVTLKNPHHVQAYISSMAGAGGTVLNENLLRFMGASDNQLFNTLLYSVAGILVAIIMIGSIFLIYNSFNISLNERMHQFGILASVGATAKQLRNSVLYEGLCIGAIGIPIGILAGIGSIGLILPVISGKFTTITSDAVPLSLSVSVPALLAAAAVSLVTVLISAYIPAKKAANTPVMECIRQTNEIKTEARKLKISRFSRRVYGLEGTLALKNFKRNKKRYRSIVLSLTLSVVLFVSGSAFGSTLKRLSNQFTMAFDYDICFYTKELDDNGLFQLYEKLKTADGVTESTYQTISTYACNINTSALTSSFMEKYRESADVDASAETVELSMNVQFIEDSIYQNFIESLGLSPADYTGQDAKMVVVAKDKTLADLFTSRSMDFTLSAEGGKQGKTIHTTLVDTYPEDPLPDTAKGKDYVLMVVAPYQMKSQFDALGVPAEMGLSFRSDTPSQSVAVMDTMIQNAGITTDYTMYNVYEVADQYSSITFVIDVFTYVFVIMISLIAVANVFNTISTNIKLRRQELAMLRSVGMSDRSFNKMMNFECAFYGMRTLLFGVPIAGLFSWLIYKGITGAERLDNFKFIFPWGSTAVSILGVFLIVFITMLYATSKIRKENIIDALRDDMT